MNYFITLISLVFLLVAHANPVFQQVYEPASLEENTLSTVCNSAGDADSYVLALSSQTGFCETYGVAARKPECLSLEDDSYQAHHLTLHGLWPNKKMCGSHYGYCNVIPQDNHCAYEALTLTPIVSEQLKIVMPSYFYGSCLERHEWNKHGSCQSLTPDDYFTLSMRLTHEVDQSNFGRYITDHPGELVHLALLRELIANDFGSQNTGKFYLGCRNGILVDIFIQLPASITFEEALSSLVEDAPNNQYHDACPSMVKLSNFTSQ